MATTLAGCAGQQPRVAAIEPPPPVAAVVDRPLPDESATRPAANLATVWNLRVALNVAALACRGVGSDALVGGYNAMLRNRRALLADAEGAMIAQYGGVARRNAYDSAMTRLYNFYANPRGQPGFCQVAARIQREEADVAESDLVYFAAVALVAINDPFVHPASPVATVVLASQSVPAYAPAQPTAVPAPKKARKR
jgi:hypothetical protein